MKEQVKEFLSQYKFEHIAADVPEGVQEQYQSLFRTIFGRETSCAGCVSGRKDFDRLVQYSKRTTYSRYVIKPDVVAYCKADRQYYTNDNLTDDIAAQIVSEGGAQLFEYIPDQEPVKEEVKEKVAEKVESFTKSNKPKRKRSK